MRIGTDGAGSPESFGRGIHILRVDYGYPGPTDGRPHASGTSVDASRFSPLCRLRSAPAGGTLLVSGCDRLLAWSRQRGGAGLLDLLAGLASTRPVLLQCRFPRHASDLLEAFRNMGGEPTFRQTPRDGSVPPLYAALASQEALRRLHLELEWVSALAAARGDVALERAGEILARSGPSRGSALAREMGVTQGAASSYLRWMQDVALVRKEGRLYDLAHPLLRLRYLAQHAEPAKPEPPRRTDDMSVD